MNVLNAPAVVMKNNASKKNYLSISFKGDSLNTFGIGAKGIPFHKRRNAIPAAHAYKRFPVIFRTSPDILVLIV
jgi:hypothetical protein